MPAMHSSSCAASVRAADQEDHMRTRQMIVQWLLANSTAIEMRRRGGKTIYVMVDAAAFQAAVGQLLAEVHRIKAEGDYEAAKRLLKRRSALTPRSATRWSSRRAFNMPSYTGFVQPRLQPVMAPGESWTSRFVPTRFHHADAGVFG